MDDDHLRQTPYSDPGDLDTGGLPRDPRRLAAAVRGLLFHRGRPRGSRAVAAARSEDDRRRLCVDPRLTVPAEITSHTSCLGDRQVTLPAR